MINTYNESELHKTLKLYYAELYGGQTEIQFHKWICDIQTPSGTIIEIQTSNLAALKEKALAAIKEKKDFIIVHPIITEKRIENYTQEGILVSKRKSPKSETIYSELKSLTGVYDILLSRYVTLIFIEISSTEQRIKTDTKIQLANKSRMYKKNWYKTGKKLTEIKKEHLFHGKKSYLELLPKLPETFSSSELKEKLNSDEFPKNAKQNANLILWLFYRMNLIEKTEKKERRIYYKIKTQVKNFQG